MIFLTSDNPKKNKNEWLTNVFLCLRHYKGNSDIERYQMANKKIPFKYTRPVEEWLQEKGKFQQAFIYLFVYVFILLEVHHQKIKVW